MKRYRLSTLFAAMTLLCTALALAVPSESLIRLVLILIIVANLLGALAGFVVTFIFKLPRDGT